MASRYSVIVVVFLAVSMFLGGCGGTAAGLIKSLAQRAQGTYIGIVRSLIHPNAVIGEFIISGSALTGTLETADGTVVGTANGTMDEDGSIEVIYKYEGEAECENGTLQVNDENGQIGIQTDDSNVGQEADSTEVDLEKE